MSPPPVATSIRVAPDGDDHWGFTVTWSTGNTTGRYGIVSKERAIERAADIAAIYNCPITVESR